MDDKLIEFFDKYIHENFNYNFLKGFNEWLEKREKEQCKNQN